MRGFIVGSLLAAAVGLGGSGCDDGGGPTTGDLHVTYRVGSGSNTCADVAIRSVRVYVLTSATATTSVRDETAACNAADQSLIIRDLPAGRYFLRLEGRNIDDHVIYTGATTTATEVIADQTNGPVLVILEQIRPSMQIWFGFSDVGGCDRHGVTEVQVVVYENGASRIFDQNFPCVERLDDSLLIADLSATSNYDLRVRALNDHSEYTHAYDQDGIAVAPGAPEVISAVLTACSGLCSPP